MSSSFLMEAEEAFFNDLLECGVDVDGVTCSYGEDALIIDGPAAAIVAVLGMSLIHREQSTGIAPRHWSGLREDGSATCELKIVNPDVGIERMLAAVKAMLNGEEYDGF